MLRDSFVGRAQGLAHLAAEALELRRGHGVRLAEHLVRARVRVRVRLRVRVGVRVGLGLGLEFGG